MPSRNRRPSSIGRSSRSPDARTFFLIVGVLVAVTTLVVARWPLNVPWLWSWLIAANVTTAVLYAYDKRAAGGGNMRVPERTLHAWAFVGGTPAAFASQKLLRHKTIKGSFRMWFWTIFVLQLALCAAYWYVNRRG